MTRFDRRPTRADRTKAAAAAIGLNLFLGAAFIGGLAIHESRAVEAPLQTYDLALPPTPEPPVVKADEPAPQPAGRSGASGEAPPVTEAPTPIPVSVTPAAGADSRSGAASAGSAPGAGTGGSGVGGGGGSNMPATNAVPISGLIGNRDNRGSRYSGKVVVQLHITAGGAVDDCRLVESSGVAETDATTCRLSYRIRFRPARMADGRAVEDSTYYVVNWRPR